MLNKLFFLFVFATLGNTDYCIAQSKSAVALKNNNLQISWQQVAGGWKIASVKVHVAGRWQVMDLPTGEYTLLYSKDKPDSLPTEKFKTKTGFDFPGVAYHYQKDIWNEATAPVALNTAGKPYYFFPDQVQSQQPNHFIFTRQTEVATIQAEWMLDPKFSGDILVKQTLTAKQGGYFSLASPSILSVEEKDMTWVTVPGYFQGNTINKDFVQAYAYGQGVPARPVVYRERCASTLCPVVSTTKGVSLSVIPEPGTGRDPWANNKNTQKDWFIGLSHRNRKAQLSPTLYVPVLGEPASALKAGDSVSFQFRLSFTEGDWYQALQHAANDIYDFDGSLELRHNQQSLTSRVQQMRNYLTDSRTSMWRREEFNGLTIGAQAYLGGVVGSQRDAMKNADYGAMWMLARATGDNWFQDSVLPFAHNFKLAQQQTDQGFFQGAASGQYFLSKRKKFVEEWGEFVEPVSLTYYTLLDIGNILLFEPDNTELKNRLRLGADLLLKWQKPDGSWDVAYDRDSKQPLFTDIKDLRPTFYGLLIAYKILGDQKYLAALRKAADWYIREAVQKGHFIGVCGDARYAPDFATGQSAQALLDLYEITNEPKYKEAAIAAARIYTTSIYTHPAPSQKIKIVNGIERKDWQISQSGLSFEHGGILGSANRHGPILLCSHAGMFIRFFQLTNDSLFLNMARASAIGRDAFVDTATGVASYYWNAFNRGAGPYPHHAWWQIGWITDYLMAEAALRSDNKILFPRGFVTPKVGPHQTYGFAPGKIYGEPATLIIQNDLVQISTPQIECITALSTDQKKLYLILLNDVKEEINTVVTINPTKLNVPQNVRITKVSALDDQQKDMGMKSEWPVVLKGYGLKVFAVDFE